MPYHLFISRSEEYKTFVDPIKTPPENYYIDTDEQGEPELIIYYGYFTEIRDIKGREDYLGRGTSLYY
ncbi:MAG: hypothetical protein HRT57_06835 [Crocinitomicaceae bacterium]|nr:hypothetical protein [Crocinitomicaceae bacterium]